MIPIICISFVLLYWGEIYAVESYARSSNIERKYSANEIDNEMDRIIRLQRDLASDSSLADFANFYKFKSPFERSVLAQQIWQKLSFAAAGNRYLKKIEVYFPSLSLALSTPNEYDNKPYSYDRNKTKSASAVYLDDVILLSLSYPPGVNLEDTLFIIDISLLKNEFLQTFKHMHNNGEYLFLCDKSGNIISSNEKDRDKLIYNASQNLYDSFSVSKINDTTYYISSNYIRSLDSRLIAYIPTSVIQRQYTLFSSLVLLFLFATLVSGILFLYYMNRLVHKPLNVLVDAFKIIETGSLNSRISESTNDEFNYLYLSYNKMLDRLNELIEENYTQKLLTNNAVLKQLQTQINPHFLYNSLFLLKAMIWEQNYDSAGNLAQLLGEYFSFITYSESSQIPLKDEIEHTRVYCSIQLVRFKDLELTFGTLPPVLNKILVPRLILQPIVENTFKYAFPNIIGTKKLKIEFEYSSNFLRISIEENGNITDNEIESISEQLNEKEPLKITGLANIHRRLNLQFGKESGLKLSKSLLGGLKVDLIINLSNCDQSVF